MTQVDASYRIDYLVENCVIVELKAVEKLLPLHLAQVLTYLNSVVIRSDCSSTSTWPICVTASSG